MPQNIGTIARPITVAEEIQNTRRATLGLSALSGRIISKRRQGGICFLDLQGATPRSSAGAQITCLRDCASRR